MSDILIAGGGPGGLLAALALGRLGCEVTLVDPLAAPRSDTRSTAFLAPSVSFFERVGIWEGLAKTALPLEALTLVDAVGMPPVERLRRTYQAHDHGLLAFAQNVPNDDLLR
ncbi:MAG: FAD-dependent monooxygenase, partial [Deltaproteobacteria bacterium]